MSSCFTQSCEQIISGRYLTYDRILEILQNEEYLEHAETKYISRRMWYAVRKLFLFYEMGPKYFGYFRLLRYFWGKLLDYVVLMQSLSEQRSTRAH